MAGSKRLFISHATEDAQTAERIVARLEGLGIECWIAPRDIQPSQVYADAIAQGISATKECVVLVSPASSRSAAVNREVELASKQNRRLIPVVLEPTDMASGLGYFLSNVQWVEFRRDGMHAIDALAAHLKDEPPPSPPPKHKTWLLQVAVLLAAVIGLLTIPYLTPNEPTSAPPSTQSDETTPPATTEEPAPSPPDLVLPEMARIDGENFEIGVYEVTFAQWDACLAGGGCNGYRPDDERWGRGNHPVINVSWNDAQAYVRWLSRRTGQRYRLPTSAEWELAARGGRRETSFEWGEQSPVCDVGAHTGAHSNNCPLRETRVVGSFEANDYGLYDVHGNVREWVGSFDDGTGLPILRGGSFQVDQEMLRFSVDRGSASPDVRTYEDYGFRVARDL